MITTSQANTVFKGKTRALLLLVNLLLAVNTVQANPELVTDANPLPAVNSSKPSSLFKVNNLLIFTLETAEYGREIWATDGATSWLVADIFPGSGSSSPANITAAGKLLFFTANNGLGDDQLWVTDGTTAGTSMVMDTIPGYHSRKNLKFTAAGNTLLFPVEEEVYGAELWKSDGTKAGTGPVKDIVPGSGGSYPEKMVSVGSTVYFSAYAAGSGKELWQTDGTTAGTILFKDIVPGGQSSYPGDLTAVSDTLFFTAYDEVSGREIWKSDGTASGTILVKDITPGITSTTYQFFTTADNTLFFSANDGISGYELWKSDGTATGTILVKDIIPGSGSAYPKDFIVSGNAVYFTTNIEQWNIDEFWISDGTEAGTIRLESIDRRFHVATIGNTLYYTIYDTANGRELWKSDTAGADAVLVKDIYTGINSSDPHTFSVLNDTLYFVANDGSSGYELWKSDGTATGTVQFSNQYNDPTGATGNSNPTRVVKAGELIFFIADDAVSTKKLWATDGVDSWQVMNNNDPKYLTVMGDSLFFSVFEEFKGFELWKSDGTTGETFLLKDINTSTSWRGGDVKNLIAFDGTLYFTGADQTNTYGTWKSDGTEAGTVRENEIGVNIYNGFPPSKLPIIGNDLYFAGPGKRLWKTDGTGAGTVEVVDTGPAPYNVFGITVLGNTVFFRALFFDPTIGISIGYELWKSDGTAAGTKLVADISQEVNGGNPHILTAVGDTLFFFANDGITGDELWKSDGTAAGTLLMKDINPGITTSKIREMTAVADTLFFVANDGIHGRELWKSDGTPAGTNLVKDIDAGRFLAGSSPENLLAVGNKLYFTANSPEFGQEVWVSDGTDAGTHPAFELIPGPGSSFTTPLAVIGDTLYFSGNDGVTGQELWKYTPAPSGTSSMGDSVWMDINDDGIRNGAEPGLGGVTVELQSCDGSVLKNSVTNASGAFRFANLSAGNYQMRYLLPADYYFTLAKAGGDYRLDSNANSLTGVTPCLSLADGQTRHALDAGMVPSQVAGTGVMGDLVWQDLNGDGIQDVNEPGMNNVSIQLLNCSAGLLQTTTTNNDGDFVFTQLLPGDYQLRYVLPEGYSFSPSKQGGNYRFDSNANTTSGLSPCLSLAEHQKRLALDAGMVPESLYLAE